jgi:hypothetical protein
MRPFLMISGAAAYVSLSNEFVVFAGADSGSVLLLIATQAFVE